MSKTLRQFIGLLSSLIVAGAAEAAEQDGYRDTAYATSTQRKYERGAQALVLAVDPDAIYRVFSSGLATSEQLRAGRVVFVENRMPLDFVLWVRADGFDLRLPESAADLQPLVEARIWDNTSGRWPKDAAQLEVLGTRVGYTAESRPTGVEKDNRIVLLRSRQGMLLRVRVNLERPAKLATSPTRSRRGEMSIEFGIDLVAIPGNDAVKPFLADGSGGYNLAWTPRADFHLVASDAVDHVLEMEYQYWRIRSVQSPSTPDGLRYWRGEAPGLKNPESWSQITDAYKTLLRLEPKHEPLLLEYAAHLERVGKYGESAEVLQQLVATVQSPTRGPVRIKRIPSGTLTQPVDPEEFTEGWANPPKEIDREAAVSQLGRHVSRLEERQRTEAATNPAP